MNSIDILEQRIVEGYRLSYDEAVELMQSWSQEDILELAHRLRTRYQGKMIETCSIMNARSGRCSEDCKWCAQSKFYNTNVDIYPLVGRDEALKDAHHNASKGVQRFSLVTSGRTLSDTETDLVCHIYNDIKAEVPIKLCASMGLLTREQLIKLRESGVERYHCNLESAPSHFATLCSTHTIEQKLQTIRWAIEVGMSVCSGGIFGMGESARQRVEFAVALRETGAVSIPVNVLNPIAGTPLADVEPLSDSEILIAFAMMRIVNPEADIRFAGGRNVFKHIEQQALQCGVSAAIVGDMLTTSGSDIDTDKAMFIKCGFEV